MEYCNKAMSRGGRLDMTMIVYLDFQHWIENVEKKYGKKFASRCLEIAESLTVPFGDTVESVMSDVVGLDEGQYLTRLIMEQAITELQPRLSRAALRDAILRHLTYFSFAQDDFSEFFDLIAGEEFSPEEALRAARAVGIHLQPDRASYFEQCSYLDLYAWNTVFDAERKTQEAQAA